MSDFKYNPIISIPRVDTIVTRRGWERPDWHRAVIAIHYVGDSDPWVVLGKCARDDRPHLVRLGELKGDWWRIEPLPPKPQVHKVRAWINRSTGRMLLQGPGYDPSVWVEVEFDATEVVKP